MVLVLIEFMYNNVVHSTNGKSLINIVYMQVPQHTLDHVPLSRGPGLSVAAENMAQQEQKVHEEVRQKLE